MALFLSTAISVLGGMLLLRHVGYVARDTSITVSLPLSLCTLASIGMLCLSTHAIIKWAMI